MSDYTDSELNQFEIMVDDLIIGIFDNKDKRYWITKMLKKAFDLGKQASSQEVIK